MIGPDQQLTDEDLQPSPSEIAARSAEIRAGWTEAERARRLVSLDRAVDAYGTSAVFPRRDAEQASKNDHDEQPQNVIELLIATQGPQTGCKG